MWGAVKKFSSSLSLLGLEGRSLWHRLRTDWARELVALLSAAVLIGVFIYIAHDFLNHKLAGVGGRLSWVLIMMTSLALSGALGVFVGQGIRRKSSDPQGLAAFARSRGADPVAVKTFQLLNHLIFCLLILGGGGLLLVMTIARSLAALELLICGLVALVGLGAGRFLGSETPADIATAKPWRPAESRFGSMVSFRLRQLLRNSYSKLALSAGAAGVGAHGYLALRNAPFVLHGLVAMAVSFLLAIPLLNQLREDLSCAWAERSMGVSHNDLIGVYLLLGMILALPYMVIMGLLTIVGGDLPFTVLQLGSLLAITALGPMLTPSLMFQIEARRPALTVVVVFLVVLFLGTALIAHLASIVLGPILHYYASRYQHGRYYRA